MNKAKFYVPTHASFSYKSTETSCARSKRLFSFFSTIISIHPEGIQASPPNSITAEINKISELNSMFHTFALHSASNLKLIQITSLRDRKVPHEKFLWGEERLQ